MVREPHVSLSSQPENSSNNAHSSCFYSTASPNPIPKWPTVRLTRATHVLSGFLYETFRNQYDNDISTWSPQGRIHQIEYALEAVKQGSAAVSLRSNEYAVLLALKVGELYLIISEEMEQMGAAVMRSSGELASYQKKLIRIDDHMGIAIAGLTSDARVLSNFMRTEAMKSKMLYDRPLPIFRIVSAIAD
ncbi:nucleophile aminohydrolase, partial [Jimgerdemannia flammicorona]